MAIDTFVNLTLSTVMAKQPDRADHRHTTRFGTADGNDITVAWDSAKVTTLTQLDSALAAVRALAASRLTP
jgi:hypothetical protein